MDQPRTSTVQALLGKDHMSAEADFKEAHKEAHKEAPGTFSFVNTSDKMEAVVARQSLSGSMLNGGVLTEVGDYLLLPWVGGGPKHLLHVVSCHFATPS